MHFENIYRQCQSIATSTAHRQLLWLSGDVNWCYAQLQSIAPLLLSSKSVGVFSKTLIKELNLCQQQITNKECLGFLGQEVDALVYDAYSGFNPDSLAIISGTLVAGGVLVLVTPVADQWQQWNDPELDNLWVQPFKKEHVQRHFLSWVLSSLLQDKHIIRYDQHALNLPRTNADAPSLSDFKAKAVTEQQQLVNECAKHLLAKPDSSIVLTAARGRGKSAALGLLVNEIGLQRSVLLTASDEQAVQQVQQFAAKEVRFYTPVQLLSDELKVEAHCILLIDEAASISVDILQRLLGKFSQCVFSTTTDGYEGTGQGFKLRFLKHLSQKKVDCQFYELTRAMRWAVNDPVENWLNKSMFLGITKQRNKTAYSNNEFQLDKIESQQLLESPVLLEQLYTLLAQAHYRTTPSDLRIILDSPNMHLWLIRLNSEIVGLCLVAQEGAISTFDEDDHGLNAEQLVQAIYRGQRRPRGNLIPQILIAQEGELAAGNIKVARVVRIATVHSHRREQLATRLLEHVTLWAHENGFDYLGANFSIDHDLLRFWQKSAFELVRIGNTQDKVTASYNALVLKAVGDNDSLLKRLTATFSYKFAYQKEHYPAISLLENQISMQQPRCSFDQYLLDNAQYLAWCKEQLYCFAYFYRPLESVGYIAQLLLKKQLLTGLLIRDQQLLDDYFIKHTATDKLYQQYAFSGYRSLVKALRSAVQAWLKTSVR